MRASPPLHRVHRPARCCIGERSADSSCGSGVTLERIEQRLDKIDSAGQQPQQRLGVVDRCEQARIRSGAKARARAVNGSQTCGALFDTQVPLRDRGPGDRAQVVDVDRVLGDDEGVACERLGPDWITAIAQGSRRHDQRRNFSAEQSNFGGHRPRLPVRLDRLEVVVEFVVDQRLVHQSGQPFLRPPQRQGALAQEHSRLQRLRGVLAWLLEVAADPEQREQLPFAVHRRRYLSQLARDLRKLNGMPAGRALQSVAYCVHRLLHAID